MRTSDWSLRILLFAIALCLCLLALRPFVDPGLKVQAQSARYDHITIVSPVFLYKGEQGLLVLDRRNANVWFIPKQNDTFAGALFKEPVFVTRLPFEKLDQAPQ